MIDKLFHKFNLLMLAIILFITFLLSSHMILKGDFFFLADQGRDYLLTKSIVVDHKLTLIGTHSGLGGFFHGPLWLYILTPVFLIGKGNPIYFAYFYIIQALVTVVISYFVGKRLYGEKIALVFALIVGLSPIVWANVPITIGVNVMPLLYVLLLYFVVKYLRGNSYSFIFVAFLTGLAFQFETASAIALVPVIIATFFINVKNIKNIKLIFYSILSFIISMGTFILFDLRHQFLMTKALLSVFYTKTHEKGYLIMSKRISDHLSSLFGVYKGMLIEQINWFNLFLIIGFIGISIYIIWSYLKNKILPKYFKEFIYLLVFPVANFIIYIFYGYPIWPEYVLGLMIPVALSLTLVLFFFTNKKLGVLFVSLFTLIYLFFAFSEILNSYFTPFVHNQTAGSYINQEKVVNWIFNDANGNKFGYFVYSPDTFTYGMDYLFWINGKKYDYLPISKKLPITYLIMYPSLQNDLGAHNFWKKNVIRTNGKIIYKKVFMGNITVEKLSITENESPVDPNYYQDLIFR